MHSQCLGTAGLMDSCSSSNPGYSTCFVCRLGWHVSLFVAPRLSPTVRAEWGLTRQTHPGLLPRVLTWLTGACVKVGWEVVFDKVRMELKCWFLQRLWRGQKGGGMLRWGKALGMGQVWHGANYKQTARRWLLQHGRSGWDGWGETR